MESLLDREVVADVKENTGVPYVAFFSLKSPKAGEVKAALPDISEGEAYLRWPEGYMRKLVPFTTFFVDGVRYYADVDPDNGKIGDSSWTPQLDDKGRPDFKSPLKEHVEAALIVVTTDRLVPAKCVFRPSKTPAASKMIKASRDAKTPDWLTYGELYQQSVAGLGRELTFARFLAIISSTRVISKVGKGAGKPYFKADAVIIPAAPEVQNRLSELLNTKRDEYTNLTSWFDQRVAYLKGIIK